MKSPLILNLAPTGMVPTRSMSPHVPLSPAEIADDCARCVDLGVSMLHLHARDDDGVPTTDGAVFADIIRAVRRRAPGAVITATTSGRNVGDVLQRATALFGEDDAKPDMASLTLSSLNFARSASVNSPDTIFRLAELMMERGIRPELEVFDLGMVNMAHILIDKGLIKPPYYFNLLLGNPSSAQARLLHLGTLVADLPEQSVWSTAGLGRFQTTASALGVTLADGVRTGLEDNLWFDDERSQPATNPMLVQRVRAMAEAQGRAIASTAQTRARLGLAAHE
ncbi:3-keto-5-aminohexanoate cleavage protein [Pseudoduganella sp. FT55W]|uniref:3-keto-5-aminohexanoate cleavage protein n=1 Tax=Duganella rivi TaxID=2666083 RepID=A0A7X4KD96_9BURK|nr:3-keto-5-aminohexanoate cleavage protein [Duganella rivi]MYM68812.1 3-keto-5-aminohexanoate cleavage protein [Duganella rivi]